MAIFHLTVRQLEQLITVVREIGVPSILNIASEGHEAGLRIIKKYANQQSWTTTSNQRSNPRMQNTDPTRVTTRASSIGPVAANSTSRSTCVLCLTSFCRKAWSHSCVFISGIRAVANEAILPHTIDSQAEFVMDVTNKTKAHVKDGTGSSQLFAIAQVPPESIEDFKSVPKSKILKLNTNS